MKNNFDEKTRELFRYAFKCWMCSKNTADALHHTVGRGAGKSTLESSPLNASLVCNLSCHITNHPYLKLNKIKTKLLLQTYYFLTENGYKFTEKDMKFIGKYAYLYK